MSSTSKKEFANKNLGFAAMDPEKMRQIASKGGKVAHAKGVAHQWTSETAKIAGAKGGRVASERLRDLKAQLAAKTTPAVEAGTRPQGDTRHVEGQ